MIGDILIQTRREGHKFITRVLREKSYDQRDGPDYELMSISLGATEEETRAAAIREAFPDAALDR